MCILSGCESAPEATGSSPAVSIPLHDCAKPALVTGISVVSSAKCGSVEVYEDRKAQKGAKIKLKVMIVPALNPQPLPDPIFILAGGPGQAATEVGPELIARLPKLRADRDIVMVDQRGTGSSSPLDCHFDTPDYSDNKLSLRNLMNLQFGDPLCRTG